MLEFDIAKEQLLAELNIARQRIAELEALILEMNEKNYIENISATQKLHFDNNTKRSYQEDEILFKTLINNIPLSIMTFDKYGIINFVNQFHLKVFSQSNLTDNFFRFIRLERTFDKMKGHGVHQVFTPMKTKRMSRHVHELLVPCVRAAWL